MLKLKNYGNGRHTAVDPPEDTIPSFKHTVSLSWSFRSCCAVLFHECRYETLPRKGGLVNTLQCLLICPIHQIFYHTRLIQDVGTALKAPLETLPERTSEPQNCVSVLKARGVFWINGTVPFIAVHFGKFRCSLLDRTLHEAHGDEMEHVDHTRRCPPWCGQELYGTDTVPGSWAQH